jgi:hypothetical protein
MNFEMIDLTIQTNNHENSKFIIKNGKVAFRLGFSLRSPNERKTTLRNCNNHLIVIKQRSYY